MALNRRDFLRRAGAGGAVAAAASAGIVSWAPGAAAQKPPANADTRIVVVGGGLAGLTAAYRLKQAGYQPALHEGNTRLGGRCFTNRTTFAADGQIAERGGEFIDTSHNQLRQLVRELGLRTDNLLQAETNGTEPLYYFDGQPYTYGEATDDVKDVWQKIHSDVVAASYPTLYNVSTARGRQLDNLSIVDWINESVPGGISSKLGQLLDVAYTTEYGGESSVQSSLNLLYLIGYKGQGNLRIFGPSDEKYRVVGGNDQIAARLGDALAGNITTGSRLTAIAATSSGTYTLTFRQGSATRTVTADRVVMAIPFSILRSSVDFSRAGFKPLKQTAIREQGMGTNAKLTVQFTDRLWRDLGSNGETFSDLGYQSSWEVSRAQPGPRGILVDYTGGTIGANLGTQPASTRAQQFATQIDRLFPGLATRRTGKQVIDDWPRNEWSKGSYSFWKVGQYQRFAGVEREREGNCHFAGEHTSVDFQGYLNGAVETGQRAADEILADLRK